MDGKTEENEHESWFTSIIDNNVSLVTELVKCDKSLVICYGPLLANESDIWYEVIISLDKQSGKLPVNLSGIATPFCDMQYTGSDKWPRISYRHTILYKHFVTSIYCTGCCPLKTPQCPNRQTCTSKRRIKGPIFSCPGPYSYIAYLHLVKDHISYH